MTSRISQLLRLKMNLETMLSRKSVRMRDKALVQKKLESLISSANSLQIVVDFDHTMTKSLMPNGDRGLITHEIFNNRMDISQRKELNRICQKYIPIEQDSSKSGEEKAPYLVEWWNQAHRIISQVRFQKNSMDEIVKEANLELRDSCDRFLMYCESMGIPILIFSAGLGDVINLIFYQRLGKIPTNLYIVSNFMLFDDKDVIIGFKPPVIHSFNKNATVLDRDIGYFSKLTSRPNVLLIGDSLGDASMNEGLTDGCNGVILKIGFFNRETSNPMLTDYLLAFDIVLIGDQTFDVPLGILHSLKRPVP